MSDETTARLGMPRIVPGQAQKELSHNEALETLDLLVQASVVAAGRTDPPGTPTPGQAWIIGSAPTGAWAGQAQAVAGWTAGGWRFLAPVEGMALWVADVSCIARFSGGSWIIGELVGAGLTIGGMPVVGAQRAAIGDVAGGTTIDVEARGALGAMLAALRGHGLIAS